MDFHLACWLARARSEGHVPLIDRQVRGVSGFGKSDTNALGDGTHGGSDEGVWIGAEIGRKGDQAFDIPVDPRRFALKPDRGLCLHRLHLECGGFRLGPGPAPLIAWATAYQGNA